MELQFKNVTKDYGNVHAVEHVTHSMGKGVYGLLGVNGAGKTTLMRMICTAITPTSGEILWNGKDIFSLGASYREILGYLPQSYGFYPDLSVYDYMLYIASIKGIRPIMAKKRALKLLEQVGMAEKRKRKMRTLSGGMIRRVGIAQAMLNDPRILVLDEPTAGLDPRLKQNLLQKVKKLHQKEKMTIIMVSHNMDDIALLADKVAIMRQGKLMIYGEPREVFTHKDVIEQAGLLEPEVMQLLRKIKEYGLDVDINALNKQEVLNNILVALRKRGIKC